VVFAGVKVAGFEVMRREERIRLLNMSNYLCREAEEARAGVGERRVAEERRALDCE
jgi:hypothetical protein